MKEGDFSEAVEDLSALEKRGGMKRRRPTRNVTAIKRHHYFLSCKKIYRLSPG